MLRIFVILMIAGLASLTDAHVERTFTWDRLNELPDPTGLAGYFAGVHNGASIIAGGSNFPESPLWEKGRKVWHDRIFVLTGADEEWMEAGYLPRPLASGVSVSTPNGVICIGGGDENRHYEAAFFMQWKEGRIQLVDLDPLPRPLAFAAAARVGDIVYVAGGQFDPGEPRASKAFFALDLFKKKQGWKELESWPGPEWMLAVAAADTEAFYSVSGLQLREGETQKERLGYLRDAYMYLPDEGWKQLPDLPWPAVAAASPSICLAPGSPLIIGGVDGEQLGLDPRRHPGASCNSIRTPVSGTRWGRPPPPELFCLPSSGTGQSSFPPGELSPGVRSPQVWRLSLPK